MAMRSSQVFNVDPSEALMRFFQEQQNPGIARRDATLARIARMKPGQIWALAHALRSKTPMTRMTTQENSSLASRARWRCEFTSSTDGQAVGSVGSARWGVQTADG